jgi:Icc-related predicted phosphoesterase
VRIAATSDLHGFLPDVPGCDLLLVAGDVCPLDDESVGYQRRWLDGPFREWLAGSAARRIVGIAGNHDFAAEEDPELLRSLPWTYLDNETAEIEGVTVFGSPLTPRFGVWAFQAPDPALEEVWARIPDETELVLVHGPPLGCGDLTVDGVRAGSPTLLRRLEDLPRLKLAVFGHIHEGFGAGRLGSARWLNVSQVDDIFEPVHPPQLLDLEAVDRLG